MATNALNWSALSFTHRPNNFAELYVADPGSFPTTYLNGQPYSIRLGVSNVSDTQQSFTLTATSTAFDAHGPLAARTLSVPAEGSRTFTMTMRPPAGTKVVVISMAGHAHTFLRLRVREVAASAR